MRGALMPVERSAGLLSIRGNHPGDAVLSGSQKAFGREKGFLTVSKQVWKGL